MTGILDILRHDQGGKAVMFEKSPNLKILQVVDNRYFL